MIKAAQLTFSMLLSLMRQNVELNIPRAKETDDPAIFVEELDWGKPLPSTVPKAENIDFVLAADCVYFEVCWSSESF
jgi:hypothetical protein